MALADNVADVLRERGLSTVAGHSLSQIDRVGGRPSVALIDLRIPGGPDCASLEHVKLRFPEISIVAMTAFRSELQSIPPVPVVDKPFETRSLLEMVEALCSPDQTSAR